MKRRSPYVFQYEMRVEDTLVDCAAGELLTRASSSTKAFSRRAVFEPYRERLGEILTAMEHSAENAVPPEEAGQ